MEPQARGLLETQSFHEADEDVVTDVDFTNMISEEEKEELKIELAKLEDEISTLRQVLTAKEKHLVEIKQKLGISLMNELKQNFSKSWHDMQTTSAYKKTHETLSHAGQKATAAISNVGTAISKKFGDMRPRLVGQATREAVLKKFSALQPMPVLRAPLLAPDSLKVKKSFSVKQQVLLSPTCLSSETCPDSDFQPSLTTQLVQQDFVSFGKLPSWPCVGEMFPLPISISDGSFYQIFCTSSKPHASH
uniref:TPD52 like 1 n=1 Tax=Cyanoderma ruficeps TaxID=181631 RepID=A0A8C3RA19_9PASS